MKRFFALLLTLAVAGCGGSGGPDSADSSAGKILTVPDGERIKLAYVTNGIDPFWTIAEAGVRAGEKEFDVDVEVLMPPKGLVDQKRMMETLLANGIHGIAVSPIDAENQASFINAAARMTNIITQDSDSPDSGRLCFIGMNNYTAGREAGKLVKKALPDGGDIMIFVGRLEQLNAQQRRQGVIDELMDRPIADLDTLSVDQNSDPISNDTYTILGTLTDNFDMPKAKSNAEDTIASYENINGMVGLFAYNMPACIEAVKAAGKFGAIKLVSFDEADATLQGIVDGHVQGTISQQPYEYGRRSVEVLAALARGNAEIIPENKFIEIQAIVVERDNVEDFWANLKKLKGEE
jgi:ribose transport system substrate-binding protein